MNLDSDSWPVATPVPVPEPERPRKRWHGPRLRWPRGRGAWRRHVSATAAGLGFLGVCFLAWQWIVGTTEYAGLTPGPVETQMFPIDRVVEFDGGVRILGYGERTGDTTRVITYELRWADMSPAAAPAASIADGRDAGPGDVSDLDDQGDDIDSLDSFIDNARPIPEFTPSSPGAPRPAVQRRTMTWRGETAAEPVHSRTLSPIDP